MSIPSATLDDVLRALESFDEEYRSTDDWRDWEKRGNFRYAIEYEGKSYPVKFIIELATDHPRQYFSGGDQANDYIRNLGLTIRELNHEREIDHERWKKFLYWGKRHHDWEKFDETERDYKLRLVKRLQIGRDALFNGDQDWFQDVKRSLSGGAHPVHWTVADNFRKWHSTDPRAVARALMKLWNPAISTRERVEQFDEELPTDVIQSGGGRMSLISFLHMAMEPEAFPPFRVTPVHKAYELTNFEKLHWSAPLVDQYLEFLEFLDLMVQEATKIGMTIKDRLDAQGIIWTVTKWGPSEDWPEADQRAMREYLGWKIKETEDGPEAVAPESTPASSSQPTLEHLADQLLVSKESLEEIQHLLADKRQVIFYGPPGTGKTYLAMALAEFFAMNLEDREEDGMVKIVQFHPSHAYEDFIEGYRPRQGADGVGFELVEGPLREIARVADSQPEVKHVLIIDEINRGNVAKVLGELYFLLEYRDEAISLQYSNEDFSLPPNLWIIGTMNTADRSIALIDAALRRRFYFVPFFPDEPPIEGLLRRWLAREQPDMLWVADVVDRANALLGDRHGAIGPSYFMREKLDEAWVERIWKHAVMPYLAEQFFGEEERLEDFALERLRGLDNDPDETTIDAPSQPE